MLPDTGILDLPDTSFILLRDLIEERLGLCYEENRRDLMADRLSPLVLERGFGSFLDYYYLLKYDMAAAGEWLRVADALAVPETYFYREMDQIRALVDVLVPQFAAQSSGPALRVWSAACASGEEPLTIAMALDEAGWFQRLPIELVATDASPAAIARARRGLYRERSLRNLSPQQRERYFTLRGDQWQVSPALLSRVRFATANLVVEADVAPYGTAPIIFMRNVFIYFSEQAIRRTVSFLSQMMPVPGYLFVGAAESLLRISTEFQLEEVGRALVYVRRRRAWSPEGAK
jgi:chemotaxis protein methyltransferase CheR